MSSLLYVDILNYTTEFFPQYDWSCGRALSKVKRFVEAARNSRLTLKAFIDEGTSSSEASAKWRSRREREVRAGEKNVPQGSTVLLGDMLRECGVEVCYSCEKDNDDTLAFHAEADGASILSQDKDMFRYIGATYTVYSKFEIVDNKLILTKHPIYDKPPYRQSSKRAIESPPAVQHSVRHIHSGVYLRGVPTPLVRALGYNPHGVVAPLRHAMYYKLGYGGPITEEWPEWCTETNSVRWEFRSNIQPLADPELIALLSSPDEAVARFFPVETQQPLSVPYQHKTAGVSRKDWIKHVMCVRSVVYELCVMSNEKGVSLLDLMLQYERSLKQSSAQKNEDDEYPEGKDETQIMTVVPVEQKHRRGNWRNKKSERLHQSMVSVASSTAHQPHSSFQGLYDGQYQNYYQGHRPRTRQKQDQERHFELNPGKGDGSNVTRTPEVSPGTAERKALNAKAKPFQPQWAKAADATVDSLSKDLTELSFKDIAQK